VHCRRRQSPGGGRTSDTANIAQLSTVRYVYSDWLMPGPSYVQSFCQSAPLHAGFKSLALDAQAKLALIVAQMYPSVHLSVCPRQLESMELSIAANFAARRLSAFFPY